jgi:hypothetical protein
MTESYNPSIEFALAVHSVTMDLLYMLSEIHHWFLYSHDDIEIKKSLVK